MVFSETVDGTYRYERKYLIENLDRHQFELLARNHPAIFSETFPPRRINNIYLDTVQRQCYLDNECGASERIKVRIRWYGEGFGEITRPVLEFKIKKNMLGRKRQFELAPFNFDREFQAELVRDLIARSELPEDIHEILQVVEPSLFNTYDRKYFVSVCNRFRLTLDWNLQFFHLAYPLIDKWPSGAFEGLSVVELKYDQTEDAKAHLLSSWFPFRVNRSSKYCLGLEEISFLKKTGRHGDQWLVAITDRQFASPWSQYDAEV